MPAGDVAVRGGFAEFGFGGLAAIVVTADGAAGVELTAFGKMQGVGYGAGDDFEAVLPMVEFGQGS